jgi:mitochondrial fission protein ELM1
MAADIKLSHAREFTNLEAGPNAGAVGFWFKAIQVGDPQLAVDVWDATILAEHYLSLLDHDPLNRTFDEEQTLADLVSKAKALQAQVTAKITAANVPVFPDVTPAVHER